MREVDKMIQSAVKKPKCDTTRCAAADRIREEGESDLADAVESEDCGISLLARCKEASKTYSQPITLKLLWFVFVIEPRMPPPAFVGSAGGIPVGDPGLPYAAPVQPWDGLPRRYPYTAPGDPRWGLPGSIPSWTLGDLPDVQQNEQKIQEQMDEFRKNANDLFDRRQPDVG